MGSRKSSIHIKGVRRGLIGHYLRHNDRTDETKNSIFGKENNFYSTSATNAEAVYRAEIRERIRAYEKRTGKKLHPRTILHFSAIVNLDERHGAEDLKKIASLLENELGTKVIQYAVHKDEGWVDEKGKKHVNYHGHIEFLGLDEEGRSVRKKLTRKTLILLQDKVAELLDMPRGICYVREKKARPRRLDTYEYKKFAEEKYRLVKKLDRVVEILKENGYEGTFDDLKRAVEKKSLFSSVKSIFFDRDEKDVFKEEIERLKKENMELREELGKLKMEKMKKFYENLAKMPPPPPEEGSLRARLERLRKGRDEVEKMEQEKSVSKEDEITKMRDITREIDLDTDDLDFEW